MKTLSTIASPAKRRAALTFADQAVSSLSNFATGVVIARLYGPADFGLYALTMTIWLAVVGIHRALITEPVIIRSGAADDATAMIAEGFSAEVQFGAVVSAIVAIGGVIAFVSGARLGVFLLSLAPWFVALLLQDYWRAMAFRDGKPGLALANDVVFVGVQALLIAALLVVGWGSAAAVITAWGLGAATGAVLGTRWFDSVISPERGWHLMAGLWPLSRWMVADFLTSLASDQAYLLLLAALLTRSDYGGFRAAYSLVGPVFVIQLAVGNIGLPEAARRAGSGGTSELRAYSRKLTRWTLALVGLYGTGVVLGGSRLLDALYGPDFTTFAPLAGLAGLAFVIGAAVFGQGIALKASGRVRLLWRVRAVIAAGSLLTAALLVPWIGRNGAGWAVVVNAVLYAGGIVLVYRHELCGPRQPTSLEVPSPLTTGEQYEGKVGQSEDSYRTGGSDPLQPV